MQAQLIATLRDILCANMSLDDGLSAVQNIPFDTSDESNTLFDIARAIEEIILRRPGLASTKLAELSIRLSFLLLRNGRDKNRIRRSICSNSILSQRGYTDFNRNGMTLCGPLARLFETQA